MVKVTFYEKPGCINNSKQKRLLIDAGHQLECKNLLTKKWSKQALLKFFNCMPVTMWFNTSAPDIKSGQLDPSSLSEDVALALMIEEPILIRRPLMCMGDEYRVGFETEFVDQWLGLTDITGKEDLQNCPKKLVQSCSSSGVRISEIIRSE